MSVTGEKLRACIATEVTGRACVRYFTPQLRDNYRLLVSRETARRVIHRVYLDIDWWSRRAGDRHRNSDR